MMEPTKANLERAIGREGKKPAQIFCLGYMPHPNPRMYKYYWRVFTLDSPWEGSDFFKNATLLSTAEFMELREKYRIEEVPCLIYSYHRPREGAIFDRTSERWKDVSYAPSWEADADREWHGHK